MLFKKELKEIPPCAFGKKLTKAESEKYQFLAVAKVEKTKRSGEILIVDYYATAEKKLQARFFADVASNNHIVYAPEDDKWSHGSLARLLNGMHTGIGLLILDREGAQKTISNYLNLFENDFYCWHYGFCGQIPNIKGATGTIEIWLHKQREEKNRKAYDRVAERERRYHSFFEKRYPFQDKADRFFLEHFNSIPDMQYIVYQKLDKKGFRYGVCSHCGKRIMLDRARPRKGDTAICIRCGTEGKLIDARYAYKVSDKLRIGIANKKDGYVTFEVSDCYRTLSDKGKPSISYDPLYRTVFDVKTKKCLSSSGQRYYWSWTHYTKWAPGTHTIVMYPDNLNDVMGQEVPYLNMTEICREHGLSINMIQMFLNCTRYPCVEYLYKMGFHKLADLERLQDFVNVNGKTAAAVLGIPKEQLKWATKQDIGTDELAFIRHIHYPLTEDQYKFAITHELIRVYERINDLLRYMSLPKLFGYLEKQRFWHYSIYDTLICFSDYARMSEEMGVHLNRKNIFPKSVFAAHDVLKERQLEIRRAELEAKQKKEYERQEEALSLINERFKRYEKEGLCIVVPHNRADFILEGQELSHCVGGERYYRNHLAGKSMIFFIRESDRPHIAKYTAEINMTDYSVVQCYGYGDSIAPKEIKAFINGFAKYLKTHPKKEINYAENLRTEKSA